MPPIAPELVPILIQFPVVGLAFVAAWFVLKWADRRHEQELAREEARTLEQRRAAMDEIARVRADHQAEMNRTHNEYRAEVARLRRRITRLENELDSIRRKPEEGP